MKKLFLPIFASFLLFSSCNVNYEGGFPFNVTQKEGTGPIKNREFNLSFDEIKVAQSIRAEIVKSEVEKVIVTAPDDILDEILVENADGKLHIHFKPNINISARNVAVKIFAKDFTKVKASSSAKIFIKDKFTQDTTDIEVSSSGTIEGNLEANNLSLAVSSSGSFTGKIWAVNFTGKASSSGDVNLSGKTKNATISASSSGDFNAEQLAAENADLKASSSGDIRIAVSDQLSAAASSSGGITVFKRGNLNISSQEKSSGGRISIQ